MNIHSNGVSHTSLRRHSNTQRAPIGGQIDAGLGKGQHGNGGVQQPAAARSAAGGRLSFQQQLRYAQEQERVNGGGSGGGRLSDAAAGAVAEVLAHQGKVPALATTAGIEGRRTPSTSPGGRGARGAMSFQQQQQFQVQQQDGLHGSKSNSGSPVGAATAEMGTSKRMPAKGVSVSEWAAKELRMETERKPEAVRAAGNGSVV